MGIFNSDAILHLFLEVLKISFLSSGVILLILFVSPVLDKKYTVFWRYLLWIVFAIRLILPFDISIPGQRGVVSVPDRLGTGMQAGGVRKSFLMADTVLPWMAYLWVSGVVCLILWQVICYAGFVRKLNRTKKYITSEGNLLVYVSPVVVSPALTGIFRPQIILPSEDYENEQLSFILAHEFTHYIRKDLWIKFLLATAKTIHWFNPVVAVMEKRAGRDMELLCDSRVVRYFTREEKKRYSETLLACVAVGKNGHLPLCTSEFSRDVKNLKERFANILKGQSRKNGVFAGVWGIGSALFISCFVILETPAFFQVENKCLFPEKGAQEFSHMAPENGEREIKSWGYYLKKNKVFGHNINYVDNDRAE